MQNFEKSFALLFFVSIFAVPNERETNNRGVAQLVSASGLGPEGPVFESQYPDILARKLTDFQWVSFLLLCILLCKIKFHFFIVPFWMVWDKV